MIRPTSYSIASPSQWSLTFEVRKSRRHLTLAQQHAHQSQWSLTFEVRKSLVVPTTTRDDHAVAMEPDL